MSAESGDLTLEPRQWWDRRMSVRNNVRYLYWLRLLCVVTGHSFTEWIDYPRYESAYCDRCMIEAQRPLIGSSASATSSRQGNAVTSRHSGSDVEQDS